MKFSSLALTLTCLAAVVNAKNTTVLVFGDSWGDTGPTWKTISDVFERNDQSADVRSAAVGGTTACGWAEDPNSLADASQSLFPELPDGPDFVWYTLGGNDLENEIYQACSSGAGDFDGAVDCVRAETAKVNTCSATLMDAFFEAFPASRIMQCGYDIQCEDTKCIPSLEARCPFCGNNLTCANSVGVKFQEYLVGGMQARYDEPQYTGINIQGAVQVAGGVAGAAVGAPVLDQGAPCEWETYCVHPTYGTPAEQAVGDAFWDLYFSKQLS